jgi:hypothetical protein
VGCNVRKKVFINMEKEIFRGNILDIGLENYGIIYNIYKEYDDDANIEYISGKEEERGIKENFYDNCILLFSFGDIWLKMNKKNFIKDMHRYLTKDGLLYIWDIDKGFGKIFNGCIKILIPGQKLREIKIRNLNFLKDSSKDKTLDLLKNYFEMLDVKSSDGIYYIKARKKAVNQEVPKGIIKKNIFNKKGFEEKNEGSVSSA